MVTAIANRGKSRRGAGLTAIDSIPFEHRRTRIELCVKTMDVALNKAAATAAQIRLAAV